MNLNFIIVVLHFLCSKSAIEKCIIVPEAFVDQFCPMLSLVSLYNALHVFAGKIKE